MDNIWKTLSAIDCSAHVKKKGEFSYLAWTWAWAMVKENYPEAKYHIFEDTVYPDSTMEVRMMVEIEGLQHTMWLPVLDFRNKPIANPDAFDINSARMRCLVKCLAMFGLGHYIYAGESVPQQPPFTDEQKAEYVRLMADGDGWGLKKFAKVVGSDTMSELFNAAPSGEKTKQKDRARGLVQVANQQLKATIGALQEAEASDTLKEIMDEITNPVELEFVNAGMDEVLAHKVNQAMNEEIAA